VIRGVIDFICTYVYTLLNLINTYYYVYVWWGPIVFLDLGPASLSPPKGRRWVEHGGGGSGVAVGCTGGVGMRPPRNEKFAITGLQSMTFAIIGLQTWTSLK
jgi:hypothetical protein